VLLKNVLVKVMTAEACSALSLHDDVCMNATNNVVISNESNIWHSWLVYDYVHDQYAVRNCCV